MDLDIVKILETKVKQLEKQVAIVTSNWHQAELKVKPEQAQQIIKIENTNRIKALEQQIRVLHDEKSHSKALVEQFEESSSLEFNSRNISEFANSKSNLDKLQVEHQQLKYRYSALVSMSNKKTEEPQTIVQEKIVFVEKEPVVVYKQVVVPNIFHDTQCKQEMARLKALLKYHESVK